MTRLTFAAGLAVSLLLPGCSGLFGGGTTLTLAQQQQLSLNAASATLATADGVALACITNAIPVCVNSKVQIKSLAGKLAADVATAQAVITAGSDASGNLATITSELIALAALIPPTIPTKAAT